jgi:lipopolysaccharide biosynthesis glycosyltransferase
MKKIRICFAIDDNYVPPFLVTISSILANRNLDEFIEIYLLSTGLKNNSVKYINEIINLYENVSLEFITIDKTLFQKYYTKTWGLATAYRLRAASIFEKFDKILYLDSDIYVNKSLYELYSIDISASYGGMVPDIWQETQKRRFLNKKQTYFNAGIFLINLKKWREDDIEAKLDKYYDENKDFIIYPDQDPLNVVLDGAITELSYKYNFAYAPIKNECRIYKNYQEASIDPIIIHYIFNKPWKNILENNSNDIYIPYYFGEIYKFPRKIKKICLKYNAKHCYKKQRYKLFNLITLLKIKKFRNCTVLYLFGFIPILYIK